MKRLTERDCIRIRAQTKHEQLKAEAIDILIDAYTGKHVVTQRYRLITIWFRRLKSSSLATGDGKNHRIGEDRHPPRL
jgi:hypothetical protein